jgi:hypothetical protein
VTLEEIEEHTNPVAATLTWPDFPEMQGKGPMGPLHLMGVDPKGELLLWKEEHSAKQVIEIMHNAWRPDTSPGYLTVINGRHALYDVVSDHYVYLGSTLRGGPTLHPGILALETVQRSWFVDPSRSEGPITTKPLPRPYAHSHCWIGANGQALFDVRTLVSFLNNHAGVIGDPYAWKARGQPQGLHTMPVQDTSTRYLVVGEES